LVVSEAEAVIKINNLVEGIEEEDSIAAWIAANSQKLGLE
jgi:death-on-curing protein